ncbi:hypothetical protein ACN22W_34310 [Burkholderia theae]|uniref:hypothetical protein n=1 Tax=Burkholderia theae TaxID=3143496 RepID=UPI003AFAF5F8
MASKSIRRATLADVAALTQIRNDAHAKKVACGDYAWGKEGDGFSEAWVRDRVSRKEVYVVELDGTLAGTFTFDLNDENHWGPQEPIAGYVTGFACEKALTDLVSAASCLIGARPR